VRSIALLAGSPYFVSGDRWPGVERAALRRVAEELRVDYLGTLKRFVVLQTLGSSDSKDLAKRLMVRIAEGERPDPGALAGGLRLLEQADLRDYLKYTAIPGLAILGGRDRLVPIALGAALSNIAPAMAVHVLPDAAHMPFATHAEDTSRLLLEFFDRHESRAEIRDERCLAR
jgi:pimeloyl-[acyl-carrier protein] methyl ester esterase